MRHWLWFLLLGAAVGQAPAAAPPIGADDAHDLVLLHPSRPYRIRFHLRHEGRSFLRGWYGQLGKLFTYLDRNGNGRLSAAEAAHAPSLVQWHQMSAGKETIMPDEAPPFAELSGGKGHATLFDLRRYYAGSDAGPVQVLWSWFPPPPAPTDDALWKRLDLDGDGKLTRDELLATNRRLAALDFSDDEMIDLSEVDGPFPPRPLVSAGATHGPALGQLPFLSAVPGKAATWPVRHRAIPPDQRPDLRIEIALDDPNRPPRLRSDPPPPMVYVSTRAGASLRLGDWLLDLPRPLSLARGPKPRGQDTAAAFRSLDRDGNGLLDSDELYRPPFLSVSLLRLADLDGDGRVSRREFTAFWDLTESLQEAVTSLRVEDHGHSLFRLLDQDGDGRLGPRERDEAWARLGAFDRGKGHLERAGLPRLFRISFGHGAAPSLTATTPPPPVPRRGPVWFRKMDRNGDGDVSLKEWLGNREQFEKLDLDGDGLIGLEEASRVTGRK
jgi:Ca2+-binding EF-hand superfamily protein